MDLMLQLKKNTLSTRFKNEKSEMLKKDFQNKIIQKLKGRHRDFS